MNGVSMARIGPIFNDQLNAVLMMEIERAFAIECCLVATNGTRCKHDSLFTKKKNQSVVQEMENLLLFVIYTYNLLFRT